MSSSNSDSSNAFMRRRQHQRRLWRCTFQGVLAAAFVSSVRLRPALSSEEFAFVLASRNSLSSDLDKVRLGRSALQAPEQGFFPGRPDLAPEGFQAPGVSRRATMLQELAEKLDSNGGTEEQTEEIRLLREQTSILVEELQLLRATLQEKGLSGLQTAASPSSASTPAVGAQSKLAVTYSEATAEREAGVAGYRIEEALSSLSWLSQQVQVRRAQGEMPIGQVPTAR
eukprot:TRINITY_DN69136_c0_g1_i1.p1 TRINITY_DN69136_c0_g1~~TRINITY_DN69136_c0_g1_i1.p1  ORF type:complete len:241 (+),score=43.26 TRINITY_DN69136_c0_g1_i1:45-725(+)